MTSEVPVHLLRGDDEALLGAAVGELVHRLVGDGDRGLVVTELDGPDYELRELVDAAQTPPFLTARRVVVGRGIGRFGADDLAGLVAYLGDPLPTTSLVLTGGGGRLPRAVVDAVKKAGGAVVDTDAPAGAKDRRAWLEDHVDASGLRLDGAARAALGAHLGEDVGRLASILDTLRATYGPGARLGVDEVAPFLGAAGSVPPWDLTDAIDRGDVAGALGMLTRMVRAGERHPLQVMAILHGHYTRLLRLDGSGIRDDKAAAEALGVKSPFQARKALDGLRRLGHDGVVRAVRLLAEADLDLRGRREWPGELVLEVLVGRLARLSAPARR
jgi:DNA polymerase-3 subunit delta